MKDHLEQFIRERRYLRNLAETTLTYYRECFQHFDREGAWANLSKASLNNAVICFRERGLQIGTINTYIRGANAFLKWLHENGHLEESLRLKPLRGEQRVLKTLTDTQLQAIINYKPKFYNERRIHVILMVLMDTGLRINEVLTLKRENVDFDNLLMKTTGKGSKERIVPFSYELRKVLYKFSTIHKYPLLFANRDGGKLRYDNTLRDFNLFMNKLGIKDRDSAFHAFRRTFATNYIRNGGNPLVLQRLLGHSTLAMTQHYVKLVTEDLQKEQHRTSLLNRLK